MMWTTLHTAAQSDDHGQKVQKVQKLQKVLAVKNETPVQDEFTIGGFKARRTNEFENE